MWQDSESGQDACRTTIYDFAVFLVNVVRVLLTKLHPAPNQHARLAARKAARAALILVSHHSSVNIDSRHQNNTVVQLHYFRMREIEIKYTYKK